MSGDRGGACFIRDLPSPTSILDPVGASADIGASVAPLHETPIDTANVAFAVTVYSTECPKNKKTEIY